MQKITLLTIVSALSLMAVSNWSGNHTIESKMTHYAGCLTSGKTVSDYDWTTNTKSEVEIVFFTQCDNNDPK